MITNPLRQRETMWKGKRFSKYFLTGCPKTFILFYTSKRWKLQNWSCFVKKKATNFHKICPAVIWPVLESKSQNNNFWKITNIAISYIWVALNINFNKIRGFRYTENCRKFKFQEILMNLKGDLFFEAIIQKIFDTNLQNWVQ